MLYWSWRKEFPCYVVAENLTSQSPGLAWPIGNVPNESDDSVKEISKQNIGRVPLLLLTTYDKMWEERNEPKNKLLHTSEPGLAEFEK